jgi:hypothetical protein
VSERPLPKRIYAVVNSFGDVEEAFNLRKDAEKEAARLTMFNDDEQRGDSFRVARYELAAPGEKGRER